MKPIYTLLTAASAALLASCGTPKDGETADAPKPAATGARVWNIGGMSVGGVGGSTAPIGEEPMGPDASLAGPGPLEAAIAANPAEPLPEGSAPTLDANIMPDGNPGEPPLAEPQSPFDPALQNPPGGTSVTPSPVDPAAPAPPAVVPPSEPPPAPAPGVEIVPPAAPPPETPSPSNQP